MLVEDLKQQLTKAEKELQQAAKFGHDLLLQNKALKAQISKPLLDPKLASEIESLLTSQVRNLTAKVRESEQSRIEISETLTLEIKNLETIIEKRNNIESKLNERIWELEVENQNQKENLTSLNDQVLKLKQESRNAGLRNVSLTSQVEVLKSTEADLRVMISSLQNQVDQARKMSSRKSSIVSAAVSEQEKMFKNIPLIDVESANKALIEQLQFEIEELNQETIELTNIKQQQFDEISELKRILEESQETIEMLKQEEQNHIPDILPLDRQLVSTPFEDDHLDDLYKQVDNPFRNENLEARKSQFLELLKQPNSRPASPQVSLSAPELATQSTGNLDFPDEAIIKKSAVSKINQPRPIYSISPSRSQIQLTRSTTKRKDDVFQPASSLNSSTSTLNKKPLRRMQSFISSHLSRDADSSDDESQVIHGEYHEPESKFDMLPIEALTFTMVGSWFQKFNRNSKNPKLRYFWVNPYNRTLNWANKPPSQTKNVNFKTAFIDSITWQEPPSTRSFPPGPEHSILVHTPDRILKIVPTSWYDQDAWTRGLSLLLKRSDRSPSKSLRNSPVKGRGGGIGMDFLMEIKANEKKESADLESSIAESREEVRSGDLFAYACL